MSGHALAEVTEGDVKPGPFEWTVFGYRCECGTTGVAQSRVVEDPVLLRRRAKANHALHVLRAAS